MQTRALFSQPWVHEYVHAETGLALSRRLFERSENPLGSTGMGKSSLAMLFYFLQTTRRYVPISKIRPCESCRRGNSLERALAVYEKRIEARGRTRPACVVTRTELSRQRKNVIFLDKEVGDYRLPIERLPELPNPGQHTCVVLWLHFFAAQRPDAQEALLRLLRSIIRMLHRVMRILFAYLYRVFEALAFRLLVLAARLRYGHRHDGDDDLHSPLLRHYSKSARRGLLSD